MNKFKYIFPFLLLLVVSNCEDSPVDVKPESTINSAVMWQDEGDARSGIAGLLDQFRNTYNGVDYLFWFEFRSGTLGFAQRLGGGAGTPGWGELFNNTLNADTAPGTNWIGFYRTINGANLALKYIPDIEFNDETEKNLLLAQAHFVRAFVYFSLARIFGDVPLVTTPYESVDNDNLLPERQPVTDVFNQIKEDINTALGLVPTNSPMDRVKPSQAAMNMLKADVYLWTAKREGGGSQDLDMAESAIDNVLSNPNYRLLDDYERIFREDRNEEIIYAIYYSIEEQENNTYNQFVYPPTEVPAQYHNNPVIVGSHVQRLTHSEHYVDTYLIDPNDSRAEINHGEFTTVDDQIFKWGNKFIGELIDGTRWFVSDTPIYRYAEALLFKAEILNAKGSTPEAINYLNQVAERAYGEPDYYATTLTQEEADDAILDERLIEFGQEGKSWFDVIRFGQAFERVPSLEGKQGNNEGNILLFPIDPQTISRNPNITQTSGY